MKAIEIFGFAGSTYVRSICMLCIEKHVEYELKPLDFGEASHLALHPFLRMPVARIGNEVLYESLAIASYIDEVCDGPRLTPADPLQRARMLQWISSCNDYLYSDLVLALLKDEGASEDEVAAARHDLEIVDRQLRDRPFLLGDELYLCDLFLAPMIDFAHACLGESSLFAGLEGIAAWRDRLLSRNSMKATA